MLREFFSKVFTDFWNIKFWLAWLPITCLILALFYFLWAVIFNTNEKRQENLLNGSTQEVMPTDEESNRVVNRKSDEIVVKIEQNGSSVRRHSDSEVHSHDHPHSHDHTKPDLPKLKNKSDPPPRVLISGPY